MPRQTDILVEERISLGRGSERNYGPYHLLPDSFVKLHCEGDVRFYAGIFSDAEYHAARQQGPKMFPFTFGSDRTSWNLSQNAGREEDYWVVLRVGVFTRSGVIDCRIERVGPDVPAPVAASGRLPSAVSWVARIVGGVWAVVKSRLFQAAGTVLVSVADYYVWKYDGPSSFFAALTAEGTLSLALVTAYFGVLRTGDRT